MQVIIFLERNTGSVHTQKIYYTCIDRNKIKEAKDKSNTNVMCLCCYEDNQCMIWVTVIEFHVISIHLLCSVMRHSK